MSASQALAKVRKRYPSTTIKTFRETLAKPNVRARLAKRRDAELRELSALDPGLQEVAITSLIEIAKDSPSETARTQACGLLIRLAQDRERRRDRIRKDRQLTKLQAQLDALEAAIGDE